MQKEDLWWQQLQPSYLFSLNFKQFKQINFLISPLHKLDFMPNIVLPNSPSEVESNRILHLQKSELKRLKNNERWRINLEYVGCTCINICFNTMIGIFPHSQSVNSLYTNQACLCFSLHCGVHTGFALFLCWPQLCLRAMQCRIPSFSLRAQCASKVSNLEALIRIQMHTDYLLTMTEINLFQRETEFID